CARFSLFVLSAFASSSAAAAFWYWAFMGDTRNCAHVCFDSPLAIARRATATALSIILWSIYRVPSMTVAFGYLGFRTRSRDSDCDADGICPAARSRFALYHQ